jgi:putative ABC transport system permease protein
MIRHIFTIIWNERRANAWVFTEYILIFCVLWICCNYISSIFRTYEAGPGFDVSRVYMLNMNKKPGAPEDPDAYGTALTFLDRVKRHPGVEYVAMGKGIPYGSSSSWGTMTINDNDSVRHMVNRANVTSDFFNVFQIPLTSGVVFDWQDERDRNKAIISALKEDFFGGDPGNPGVELIPISQIQLLTEPREGDDLVVSVVGTAERIINAYNVWGLHLSTVFTPLSRQEINLYQDIAMRVKPGIEEDFVETFKKEMDEQLAVGPYFLASVKPLQEIKDERATDVTRKMNSVYAVSAFVILNIFFGILGTFWLRTQSRRSEIGLRLALGSSKQLIRRLFISETLLLLLSASIIGTVICLNLFRGPLLDVLGIPVVDRIAWKIGWEQDILNFVLTFGFLLIVSVIAVLYPANQAAKLQPAETLIDE